MRESEMSNRWKRSRAVTGARRRSPVRSCQARDGFTLIELMVAIMILVVGVLGLAGTAGMVSRMVGGAAQQTIAANIAASRFETLRSVPCASVVGGDTTIRNISEVWSVTPDPTNANLSAVANTITYTAAGGRSRTLAFQSYIICTP
jgi:prepilin-type N-terminal cleavage/methylation domain-containing protein